MTVVRIEGQEGAGAGPESIGPLAQELIELEERLGQERPDAVRLADDSDSSLAAALVAAKLLIPVQASEAATSGASGNARLIAQLAGRPYTARG